MIRASSPRRNARRCMSVIAPDCNPLDLHFEPPCDTRFSAQTGTMRERRHVTRYTERMAGKRDLQARKRTAPAASAAERMRQMRARRKAAGLRAVIRWEPTGRSEAVAPFSDHRMHEARSLVMHCVIAQRLVKDPSILARAQRNLERWAANRAGATPHWIGEWRQILRQPVAQIAALISEPSERSARLRQSSPFAGTLSVDDRRRILDAFRA